MSEPESQVFHLVLLPLTFVATCPVCRRRFAHVVLHAWKPVCVNARHQHDELLLTHLSNRSWLKPLSEKRWMFPAFRRVIG